MIWIVVMIEDLLFGRKRILIESLGFDMFDDSTIANSGKTHRIIKCWFEPWEERIIDDKSDSAYNQLLTKYCGLEFIDLDPPNRKFRTDNELMWNELEDKWCLKCISSDVREDDDITDIENGKYVAPWAIRGSDVYDCLYSYYTDHSNLGILAISKKDDDDDK